MAESNLTTCRDCGESVSNKAKTCPHCGASKPWKRSRKGPHPAWYIFAVFIIASIWNQFDRVNSPKKEGMCDGLRCDVYVVTTQAANVRQEPTTDSPVVITIQQGREVFAVGDEYRDYNIKDESGEWMHFHIDDTGGKSGWIHTSLIEFYRKWD